MNFEVNFGACGIVSKRINFCAWPHAVVVERALSAAVHGSCRQNGSAGARGKRDKRFMGLFGTEEEEEDVTKCAGAASPVKRHTKAWC